MVSAGLDTAPRSADTLVHDLNTKSSSEMSGHLLCVQRSYEEIKREISICSEFEVRSVSAARFIPQSEQTDRSWWDSAAFLRDVRFTFFSNFGFVPVQFKDYVPKVRLKSGDTGHLLLTVCCNRRTVSLNPVAWKLTTSVAISRTVVC